MGLSLHNTVAVIQGYLGKKTAFVRTPKFNIQGLGDSFKKTNYRNYRISWTTIFEGILAIYFTAAVIYGFQTEQTDFILFHVLLAVGYGTIFLYTLKHLSPK